MRNALTQYTTKTGRARSPGRVTRASLTGSGRKHDGAPLPIELQVHPKALTPTSRNPECLSALPWGGAYRHHAMSAYARGERYFTLRVWPNCDGDKYALYVQGRRTYTTNDLGEAMGWKHAASDYGVKVELFIN